MNYDALMIRAGALQWALELVQEQGGKPIAFPWGVSRPLDVIATAISEELVKLKLDAQRIYERSKRVEAMVGR